MLKSLQELGSPKVRNLYDFTAIFLSSHRFLASILLYHFQLVFYRVLFVGLPLCANHLPLALCCPLQWVTVSGTVVNGIFLLPPSLFIFERFPIAFYFVFNRRAFVFWRRSKSDADVAAHPVATLWNRKNWQGRELGFRSPAAGWGRRGLATEDE